ncbi:MAG: sugar phosphate nucleotidyltransferase [Nitrososphaerota archaeon]|nr:sugar phosphate nucleotidyltransferase [Nitrososphaerota archaeon]
MRKVLPVFIMAGGEGTRLRPLTSNRPKPMVPIANKPVLEHTLEMLLSSGFKKFILTLHYMPMVVERYFGDGSNIGGEIDYSIEDKPMGTAGGVRSAIDRYGVEDESILVWSGDVLSYFDVNGMLDFHRSVGSTLTIASTRIDNPVEFGVLVFDDRYRVRRIQEKPSYSEVSSLWINCGVYILEPEAYNRIPPGKSYDFSKDLIPLLLSEGEPVYVYPIKGYWNDIGTPLSYLQANLDLLNGRAGMLRPAGLESEPGVWVEDVDIPKDIQLTPPVAFGRGSSVGSDASIGPSSVVGRNVSIGDGASIARSVIWDSSIIGGYSKIDGSIVCESCILSENVLCNPGAVIGDRCRVGKHSVIRSSVRIWPERLIDSYSIVSSDIRWGIRWYSTLFTSEGVAGAVNVEITPDFAAKLGLAIGSWLNFGGRIAVARDNSTISRMVKRSLVSGLLAAGVDVENLTVTPLPLLSFYIAKYKLDGGVYVSTPSHTPGRILIKVLDRHGIDISGSERRAIDEVLFKESFRRVQPEDVGELTYPAGFIEEYVDDLLDRSKIGSLRDTKLIVNAVEGSTSIVLPILLDRLDADIFLLGVRNVRSTKAKGMLEEVEATSRVVRSISADLGFVFDCSGSRILVVDDEGIPLQSELTLGILASHLAETGIVGKAVMSSSIPESIYGYISGLGYDILRCRRDPSILLRSMIEFGAVFGGDETGRLCIPRLIPFFDSISSMIAMLELLSRHRVSSIRKRIPLKYRVEGAVELPRRSMGRVMARLREELGDHDTPGVEGLKIIESDTYVSILPSIEESMILVCVESEDPEIAKSILRRYEDIVRLIASSEG